MARASRATSSISGRATAQIAEVAAAAVALRALRREIMAQLGYSLRALYRTLEEPGANPLREAHTRLDTDDCVRIAE